MTADPTAPPRPRWRRMLGSPWFHLAAAFVVVGLVLSFVAKPFWVPSGSMEHTLEPGDRVLVNRLAYVGSQPATGDVIVFDADDTWGIAAPGSEGALKSVLRWLGEVTGFGPTGPHTLVKRVIAGPGQTVSCCDAQGRIDVDGSALDEPYLGSDFAFAAGTLDCTTTPRSMRCFDKVTVPAQSYLVLGDNRTESSDSAYLCRGDSPPAECWRFATRSGLVGKAVAILWPIGRWRGL